MTSAFQVFRPARRFFFVEAGINGLGLMVGDKLNGQGQKNTPRLVLRGVTYRQLRGFVVLRSFLRLFLH